MSRSRTTIQKEEQSNWKRIGDYSIFNPIGDDENSVKYYNLADDPKVMSISIGGNASIPLFKSCVIRTDEDTSQKLIKSHLLMKTGTGGDGWITLQNSHPLYRDTIIGIIYELAKHEKNMSEDFINTLLTEIGLTQATNRKSNEPTISIFEQAEIHYQIIRPYLEISLRTELNSKDKDQKKIDKLFHELCGYTDDPSFTNIACDANTLIQLASHIKTLAQRPRMKSNKQVFFNSTTFSLPFVMNDDHEQKKPRP